MNLSRRLLGIIAGVNGAHIDAIISMGPLFCHSLQDFRAGDAETGKGAGLSDNAIIRLARAGPNLVHVGLDGATHLTDESLLALFVNCASLRYIQFLGDDKVAGTMRGTALSVLRDTPSIGKELVKLRLTDRAEFDKGFTTVIKTLSAARKRPSLIEVGNYARETWQCQLLARCEGKVRLPGVW